MMEYNKPNFAVLFATIFSPHYFFYFCLIFHFHTVVANMDSYVGSDNQFSYNQLVNQVPRIPNWNSASLGNPERQIDFTQLFELMGEPRGNRGRELSEQLISRPKPKCNRRIRIFNGVTRIRERGSLARFQCSHGFTLIGPTTIVCLRDRWSEPPPICVRSGCRPLQQPTNGVVRQSIGGAVAAFFCQGNAKLIGDPIVFCDGTRWNGTEPICYLEPPPTTTVPSIETTLGLLNYTINSKTITSELVDDNETTTPVVDSWSWDLNTQTTKTNKLSTVTPTIASDTFSDHPDIQSGSSPETRPTFNATLQFRDLYPITESTSIVTTDSHVIGNPVLESISTTGMPTQQEDPVNSTESNQSSFSSSKPLQDETTTYPVSFEEIFTPKITTTRLPVALPNITGTNISVLQVGTTRPTRRKGPAKRTRRPSYPRKGYVRKTTTVRPTKFKKRPKVIKAQFVTTSVSPTITSEVFTTLPGSKTQVSDNHFSPISDYSPVYKYHETFSREQVESIRPILPDQLNNHILGSSKDEPEHVQSPSIIGGIVLFILGFSTFSAGVIFYCWRRNKGIARARPYDMDGRTLSAYDDANDDFYYLEQRDSGL